MAGLRNTVIAKAHATISTGNTQRKAAVGEPKTTKAGMAMNNADAKTIPNDIKGKRVPIQRCARSESPPIKGSITAAKTFSKISSPVASPLGKPKVEALAVKLGK
jgi:hypothetical protein